MKRIFGVILRFPRELNSGNIKRNDGFYLAKEVRVKMTELRIMEAHLKPRESLCSALEHGRKEMRDEGIHVFQTRTHVSPFYITILYNYLLLYL